MPSFLAKVLTVVSTSGGHHLANAQRFEAGHCLGGGRLDRIDNRRQAAQLPGHRQVQDACALLASSRGLGMRCHRVEGGKTVVLKLPTLAPGGCKAQWMSVTTGIPSAAISRFTMK